MSAPEEAAHDITVDAEIIVATSLDTSSAEGSSGQELTLDSKGPPTGIGGECGSSMDDLNDGSDARDKVPGSPLSSPASPAELSDQNSDGTGRAATGTDQEQSNQLNSAAPSAVVTEPLNREPMPYRVPDSGRNEEAIPMDSPVMNQETQPRVTGEAARLSASVNIPPHLRPGFVAPVFRSCEPVQTRTSPHNRSTRGNSLPYGSRSNHSQHDSRHDNILPAEIVRLNAQILKIQNDLVNERTKNLIQRQQIESEQRQYLDVVVSSMVTDLLHEQITVLTLKASFEAKERDILFRERRVSKIEELLVVGQKQSVYELDERHMNAVQLDHMRREVDLEIRKDFADHEARLAVEYEKLRLRASAQEKREELYKILMREALETEIKQRLLREEEANKMTENVSKRGVKAGKQEFLQGYHACHRAQATLSMFRKGEVARDSPELDFLFDSSHPDNMFNMALQIGRLGLPGATESEASGVEAHMPARMAESNHGSEVTLTNDGIVEETSQVPVNHRTVAVSYNVPALAGRPRTPSRSPPTYSRPTLAAELRGPSPTYNGRTILANNDALRASTPEKTAAPAVQDNQGVANLIDLL